MKLWIDDIRTPPDGSWHWAKTSHDALLVLKTGMVSIISFDHDLGGEDTSMPVAMEIERLSHDGVRPPQWKVHSMNPVDRLNLLATLYQADCLYEEFKRSK